MSEIGTGRPGKPSPSPHVMGHIRGTPSWQGTKRLARYDSQYYYTQWAGPASTGCGTLMGTIEENLGFVACPTGLTKLANQRRSKIKRQLKSIPHRDIPRLLTLDSNSK